MGGQSLWKRIAETTITKLLTIAATAKIDLVGTLQQAPVSMGAALTINRDNHDGKTLLFDNAAGSVATLPKATGSGARFPCVVSVLATSNAHVLQVGDAADIMQGYCGIIDTDSADATILFATEADSDTVTFNRSTTGLAAPGDRVEVEDIAAGVWAVKGAAQASGTVATPFSAAVS